MNQLSMDNPKTNWALLKKFITVREENNKTKLAEIWVVAAFIFYLGL